MRKGTAALKGKKIRLKSGKKYSYCLWKSPLLEVPLVHGHQEMKFLTWYSYILLPWAHRKFRELFLSKSLAKLDVNCAHNLQNSVRFCSVGKETLDNFLSLKGHAASFFFFHYNIFKPQFCIYFRQGDKCCV